MSKQLYQDFLNREYIPLTIMGGKEPYQTQLVQERITGKICIYKVVPRENVTIYQRLGQLRSPHLVPLVRCFEQNGLGIIVEEYISGETLDEKLRKYGVMPAELVQEYIGQLLNVLEQIHGLGIVHRDISPKNVLVSTDGVVKLLDFGISRERKEGQTSDTEILGTVGYASPEQFGFQQTDARADIYATGVLMNVMLEGCLPNEHLTGAKSFHNVIIKCIQMEPKHRYRNVAELRKALRICTPNNRNGQKDKSVIPGFRTGETWREVLAIFGYLFLGIGTVSMMAQYGKTPQAFVLELLALTLYTWGTLAISSNFLRWDRRIPWVRSMQKPARITLRVVLAILIFYLGVLLENYVKYFLLGLPLK